MSNQNHNHRRSLNPIIGADKAKLTATHIGMGRQISEDDFNNLAQAPAGSDSDDSRPSSRAASPRALSPRGTAPYATPQEMRERRMLGVSSSSSPANRNTPSPATPSPLSPSPGNRAPIYSDSDTESEGEDKDSDVEDFKEAEKRSQSMLNVANIHQRRSSAASLFQHELLRELQFSGPEDETIIGIASPKPGTRTAFFNGSQPAQSHSQSQSQSQLQHRNVHAATLSGPLQTIQSQPSSSTSSRSTSSPSSPRVTSNSLPHNNAAFSIPSLNALHVQTNLSSPNASPSNSGMYEDMGSRDKGKNKPPLPPGPPPNKAAGAGAGATASTPTSIGSKTLSALDAAAVAASQQLRQRPPPPGSRPPHENSLVSQSEPSSPMVSLRSLDIPPSSSSTARKSSGGSTSTSTSTASPTSMFNHITYQSDYKPKQRASINGATPSRDGASTPTSNQTKAKCLVDKCMSFSARGVYCLRHCWKERLEQLEPVNVKQFNVAKEIVTTEKSYLEGLRAAYRSFYIRLVTMIDMKIPILSQEDLNVIFHNLEDIYKLSENLYTDLEEIMNEKVLTSQIGLTLLHYSPQFRVYQTYLENYDDAIKRIYSLRTPQNVQFEQFIKVNEKCEGLSLESLLIMPVQRLPRYLLLLQELLKRTPPDDPCVDDLTSALEKIRRIADAINASLHQKESTQKVLVIQNQFEKDDRYMDLVSPSRYLIKDGDLKKRFSKGSRHISAAKVYHFFVFNDILVYASSHRNVRKGVTYKLKHALPIQEMTVEAHPGPKHKHKDIIMTCRGRSFAVSCDTREDRDSWMRVLEEAIAVQKRGQRELNVTNFDGSTHKIGSKLAGLMGVS